MEGLLILCLAIGGSFSVLVAIAIVVLVLTRKPRKPAYTPKAVQPASTVVAPVLDAGEPLDVVVAELDEVKQFEHPLDMSARLLQTQHSRRGRIHRPGIVHQTSYDQEIYNTDYYTSFATDRDPVYDQEASDIIAAQNALIASHYRALVQEASARGLAKSETSLAELRRKHGLKPF